MGINLMSSCRRRSGVSDKDSKGRFNSKEDSEAQPLRRVDEYLLHFFPAGLCPYIGSYIPSCQKSISKKISPTMAVMHIKRRII